MARHLNVSADSIDREEILRKKYRVRRDWVFLIGARGYAVGDRRCRVEGFRDSDCCAASGRQGARVEAGAGSSARRATLADHERGDSPLGNRVKDGHMRGGLGAA